MTDEGCRACPENTYSEAGATACSPCPEGTASTSGARSEADCVFRELLVIPGHCFSFTYLP